MENINSSEQIILEKRKRHQAYAAMDYLISVGTYFDFFSIDAFKLIESTNYLAQKLNRPISTDLLFLSYFYCNSSVFEVLKSLEFQDNLEANLAAYFPELTALEPPLRSSKTRRFGQFLKNLLNFKPKIQKLEKQDYSHEILLIFEKASENALTRFKTPVITSEILFITLMEESSTKISKIIKNCLANQMEWYLFRYELMKVIHKHESIIRSDVVKNQQYFAYLLRTQLPTSEFDHLIENEELGKGVLIFRNSLILSTLKTDLFETLLKDINMSIKITNKRTYSS